MLAHQGGNGSLVGACFSDWHPMDDRVNFLTKHALGREAQMLGDCVHKTARDFAQHACELSTSFDAIRDVYAAARDAAAMSKQGPA